MTLELKTQKDKVRFAIEQLLTNFEKPHFPRSIQSKTNNGTQRKVHSIDEILDYFEESDWLDCRISVFSEHEINEVLPNGIFIDLDKIDELQLVKARIYRLVKGVPLVIFTGRGLGLFLPIEINSMKHLVHENMDGEEISRIFLRFMKDYLTSDRADPASHPSLKNSLLRVPYTINSKNNKQVEFQESWNGQRVSINNIPFKQHLDKIIQKNNKVISLQCTINPESFSWIENVLSGSPIYKSNRILGLIITRYLVNVKKVSKSDAVEIIKKWDSRYDTSQINSELTYALKHGKVPVGFNRFTENNPDFASEFKKIPNLFKHNENIESIEKIEITNYDSKTNKFLETNVTTCDEIGFSKTKDLYHFLLQCYDCNPRGAGAYEIHEQTYKFHENRCTEIRYLTREEEIKERVEACYARPLTERESKLLRELS